MENIQQIFLANNSSKIISKIRSFPLHGVGTDQNLFNKTSPTNGLLDQVNGWLQQLSPGVRLTVEPVKGTDDVLLRFSYVGQTGTPGSNLYRPTNVGFGLTYSLPIIVACLAAPKDALLLLENPEAHIHPQGQAALGNLIACCATDGVQIILETHSDHVLNGIRLAVKEKKVTKDDVVIHYFTRAVETGDVFVQSPAILENGGLSNWPEGFFDQWDKSIDALIE